MERIDELKKTIMTLQWDKKRNSINGARAQQLKDCEAELAKLTASEA